MPGFIGQGRDTPREPVLPVWGTPLLLGWDELGRSTAVNHNGREFPLLGAGASANELDRVTGGASIPPQSRVPSPGPLSYVRAGPARPLCGCH